MKITGTIVSKIDSAKEIAAALSPDNENYMECVADDKTVVASVNGDSIKTVLATVDDYLMNLAVACKVLDNCKVDDVCKKQVCNEDVACNKN